MAYKSSTNTDNIELKRLTSNESDASTKDGATIKKSDRTVTFHSSDIDINGNKMPKQKNVQFTDQQVSFEYDFEVKPNLIPNRKREEETVMDNLRRRVGDLQLDKNWKQKPKDKVKIDKVEDDDEEKPLVKVEHDQTTDNEFIIDCLCWHNEYRARHGVPALTVSMKLCVSAQEWANHLASRNEIYYCPTRIFNFGQNIFCCVETSLMLSISGQEVASYWYSSIKRYDFFKSPHLLHINVNAGHFTQMVWKNTKYVGIGKAISNTGKTLVVGKF